jgi:IstB-like ATP binding protein
MVTDWRNGIGYPPFADAILDQLVHNAYKINPQGNSMRNPREN